MATFAHPDRISRHVAAQAKGVGPRQAQRVLILEDHCLVAMLMVETLRGMGHRVCAIAATPSAAAATRHLPDLMIVDEQLQHGSGPATVRKIVALNGFVPHVLITRHEAQSGVPWPAWRHEHRSMHLTNFALLILYGGLGVLAFGAVALVLLAVIIPSSIAGVWLFSRQHRFEQTRWRDGLRAFRYALWDEDTAWMVKSVAARDGGPQECRPRPALAGGGPPQGS